MSPLAVSAYVGSLGGTRDRSWCHAGMAEKQHILPESLGLEERQLMSKARGTAMVLRWQSKPLLMGAAKEAI